MNFFAAFVFAFVVLAVSPSQQASVPSDPYYTAGVVEFRPTLLDDNLQAYLQIIGSAEAAPTDILVFPEMTLSGSSYTYVPSGSDGVTPCDETASGLYENFLVQLSCAARNASKYLVVNVGEKENCLLPEKDPRPCSSTGLNQYNTNVVFDRQGQVISRYRKVNLYGENKNTTYIPEVAYFDTDFGVRFGHFICFDLLFYTPAQLMADQYGIRDFIFPTMWFSQLPFLTGVQIHAAWSYANDANFLAAGASNPLIGSTGSGIYAGRQGPLVAVMNKALGERKVYVAQVPKKSQERRAKRSTAIAQQPHLSISSDLILLKRDYLQLYHSVPINMTDGVTRFNTEVCIEYFCCVFDLHWRSLNAPNDTHYYSYRVGVLDNWRNEVGAEMNYLKNCAVFSCIGDDIMDCGKVFTSTSKVQPQVAFDHIEISAWFPKSSQILIMPNSLKDDLMPLDVNQFELNIVDQGSVYWTKFVLNSTVDNLMTFAAYANYYDHNADGGASLMAKPTILMLLTLVLLRSLQRWF